MLCQAMSLEQLYHDLLLDHNRSPRNVGRLEAPTHSARGHDGSCGDDLFITLKVADGVISTMRCDGQACAVTTASASMLSEWIEGRSLSEFHAAFAEFSNMLDDPDAVPPKSLGPLRILQAVARFPGRRRNALLPWRTVGAALEGIAEVDNVR